VLDWRLEDARGGKKGERHPVRVVIFSTDIDSYFINTMIKDANDRLRPFVQHPILVIPLFTTGDFSYPSGHASGMELQARILAELFPKKREALLQRARQIADGRVVAGVHYASDTEAGLTLGDLHVTERRQRKGVCNVSLRSPRPRKRGTLHGLRLMLTRMRVRGSLIKGQHAPTRVVRRLTYCPRSSDGRHWQRNLSTE
jgi:hypothetical protein